MSTSVSHGVFQNEIVSMMHVFGDVANGSVEVAAIIEEVTLRQIREVIRQAAEVTALRGGNNVSREDVLFLLRGNKRKLQRIIKQLNIKELARRTDSLSKSDEEDDDDEEELETSEDPLAIKKASKRLKLSLNFLSNADKFEVLNFNKVDAVTQQRNERMDKMTQSMDSQQYIHYSESRRVNFHKNLVKFKDWLDISSITPLNIQPNTVELFGYLAYDTVQEVVELSLLVKREQESPSLPATLHPVPPDSPPGGQVNMFIMSPDSPQLLSPKSPAEPTPLSPTMVAPPAVKQRPRKRGRPPKQPPVVAPPTTTPEPTCPPPPPPPPTAIHPSHVREALRRHGSLHSPLAVFSTHRMKPSFTQRTLCL